MHYKNGREAKPGDQIVLITPYEVLTGVIYGLNPGATTCNARLVKTDICDRSVTIGQCLHVDDIVSAFIDVSEPK